MVRRGTLTFKLVSISNSQSFSLFFFFFKGVDELTPPIRRWIYLATTFCDIASPLVTYGCIFLGSCIVVAVIVNGYKSLIFTKETIEIGMKNLRRHSSFVKNYTLLDDMTATV